MAAVNPKPFAMTVARSFDEVGEMRWWWMVAALGAVGSMTLSQGVLSIIGEAPEFFIAKSMTPAEVVVAGSALVIAPALFALPILAVRVVSRRLAAGLLAFFLGLFLGVLILHRLDVANQTGEIALGAGAVVGLAFALLYLLSDSMRWLVRFLTPAPLVILGVFVFLSPTSDLIFADATETGVVTPGSTDTPVVLLVFDEFPLSSVMNGEGELVTDAFPGLGRLAADGVWYRNAVTNSPTTVFAIPSILTGIIPDPEALPTVSDHPNSVFTAFRSSHEVRALEPVTALCPISVCEDETRADRWGIWEGLANDIGVILGHIALPNALADVLPPIDQTWGGFVADRVAPRAETDPADPAEVIAAAVQGQRRPAFAAMREMIGSESRKPLLAAAHFLLPHVPWTFLPDGTLISDDGSQFFVEDVVVEDPWQIALAMQRHLLAAQYVDREIARIMTALEERGIYDESLIIVTSDHGLSFRPNTSRRGTSPSSFPGIAPVLMFVKYPEGTPGAPGPGSVDDTRAETIDIVPTIFDALDVDAPYRPDGISLLDVDRRGERTETTLIGYAAPLAYPGNMDGVRQRAADMDRWFPNRDPWELQPPDADPSLVGREATITDDPEIEVAVRDEERFNDVTAESEPYPSVVIADVEGVDVGEVVAVTVDGTVVTQTQTSVWRDQVWAVAVLPPGSLGTGDHQVRMGVVRGEEIVE